MKVAQQFVIWGLVAYKKNKCNSCEHYYELQNSLKIDFD